MKKIITASMVIVMLAIIVTAFAACGEKKTENTTSQSRESTVRESSTMLPHEDDGKISESSGDSGGVAGDIVSDVSRGLTDLSEALSEAF